MAVAARGSAFQNVYSCCPPPCQKQYPASFLWTEKETEREGVGVGDRVSLLLFSYIFKYFAWYLDLISDLGDRETLEIHFQLHPGLLLRTDTQRGPALRGKLIGKHA